MEMTKFCFLPLLSYLLRTVSFGLVVRGAVEMFLCNYSLCGIWTSIERLLPNTVGLKILVIPKASFGYFIENANALEPMPKKFVL